MLSNLSMLSNLYIMFNQEDDHSRCHTASTFILYKTAWSQSGAHRPWQMGKGRLGLHTKFVTVLMWHCTFLQ